ncbi:TIGR04076 family protein [Herbiconiux sp. 11R-BC]|uniref:TIGR04076 family protein n=1 Tax=Herbiconiux sp. 11R-BC TaxID=3111637 RepID=UPI003BFBF84E
MAEPEGEGGGGEPDMTLFDLRVVVESIEGRSVCGMRVGDFCEVVSSNELRIPEGKHFCIYALQAAMPMIPAKQRQLPAADWLEKDTRVACPDPEERLIMRIDRIGTVDLVSDELT